MNDMRQGTCPVCTHHEIIEARPHHEGSADLILAVAPDGPGFFATVSARGQMHSFTRRSCGYTQLYAEAPESIPIADTYRTRLIIGPSSVEPVR